MNIVAIFDLVTKGLGVVDTLITAGRDAAPAIKVVTDLVSGAKTGTVTDAELTASEAALDQMITDFNQPIA